MRNAIRLLLAIVILALPSNSFAFNWEPLVNSIKNLFKRESSTKFIKPIEKTVDNPKPNYLLPLQGGARNAINSIQNTNHNEKESTSNRNSNRKFDTYLKPDINDLVDFRWSGGKTERISRSNAEHMQSIGFGSIITNPKQGK